MNRKQLAAMWVGVLFALAAVLVPPHRTSASIGGWVDSSSTAAAHYNTEFRSLFSGVGYVEVILLAEELFVIGLITAGLILTFKDRRD